MLQRHPGMYFGPSGEHAVLGLPPGGIHME